MEEDELEALLEADSPSNPPSPNSPLTSSFHESSSLPSPPHTPRYSARSNRHSDSPRREGSGMGEARPRRNNSSISNGGISNGAGMAGKETKRFSLAFELASAGNTVGRGSEGNLSRSLGIDENELGGGEEAQEGYSDELDSEEEALREREDFMGNGLEGNGDSEDGLMRTASHSMDGSRGEDDHDDTNSEISNFEGDLTFDETTTALEDSLRTTESFLVNLRQHTITDLDSPSPHILSSPLSNSLERNAKSLDYVDRQPVVELLATTLIKSLYDAVKIREAQNRELGMMEREVAETDEAWEAILGGLEELEEEEELGDTLFFIASGRGISVEVVEDAGEDSSFSPREEGLSDEDHTTTLTPPYPPSPSSSTSKAQPTLNSLRTTTSSLLSTLSSLSDHSQISRSSTTEASRKLRSLRSQLTSFIEDLSSLAQAEKYVRLFEAAQIMGKGKGRFGREAMDCLRGVEIALAGFESRRTLLVGV